MLLSLPRGLPSNAGKLLFATTFERQVLVIPGFSSILTKGQIVARAIDGGSSVIGTSHPVRSVAVEA
jgi:hypothetical protein